MQRLKPYEITGQLRIRNLFHRDVAEAMARAGHPVHRSLVTHVILGRKGSVVVRRAIAKLIKMPYSEVWGEADPETGKEN